MSKEPTAPMARRHEGLLQLVEDNGQMSVEELATQLGVSDDTIRRDLRELQRRKVLLRTHGGAVSAGLLVHRETPFLTRATAQADVKARIGRAAAQLISDGERLVVNGGSTTLAFVASLASHRNLTLVTNNVAVLSALPAEAIQEVYVLSGEYRINLGETLGPVGFRSAAISVDTAILGVSGITAATGLSTTLLEEASMQAQMIACASRAIVIADASKFGHNTFAQFAPLDAIDILVTDASPPADLSQALDHAGVEVIVAPA